MVSGRTSIVSSVIAALCIFAYIAAISFGAVQIIVNVKERQNRAEQEFNVLADRATSSAVFLGFMSAAYQETIRDFLASSRTPLLGLIITGPNGEYAFEREPGSGVVWTGNSPRLKSGAGYPGEPFSLPLRIEGQRNVNIRAVYSYIDYNYFQGVLRNTLLVVLAALAAALGALLIEIIRNSAASPVRHEKPVMVPESRKREKEIIRRPDFGAVKTGESTGYPGFDEYGNRAENELPGKPEKPAANNAVSGKDEHPEGLYTPRGSIGWESYTHDRLASELHRCASFEQDLVFVIMEFAEINDAVYRQFAEETVSFFSMRDLIFEKGEKGISVIIPSTDLEQGMAMSEEFRSRIIAKLPEKFKGRDGLRIGLSSRSGRLIDAARIMLEAGAALEKARRDPVSQIVAFKSDLEKYRAFVKKQNAG
jgi:hypothetical protein